MKNIKEITSLINRLEDLSKEVKDDQEVLAAFRRVQGVLASKLVKYLEVPTSVNLFGGLTEEEFSMLKRIREPFYAYYFTSHCNLVYKVKERLNIKYDEANLIVNKVIERFGL